MRRIGIIGAVMALTVGCARDVPPPPDVVVSLTDDEIRYEAFESYLARTLAEEDAVLASDVLSGLFDQFLDEYLLRRWIAAERPNAVPPGGDALFAFLESLPLEPPSEIEIESYFEENRQLYRRPERVRLRQILVDTPEAARAARQEVLEGSDFGSVADKYARHAFTPEGGDQGVLGRQDLPPAFVDIVFALEEGEISPVVSADYGYHLFQVVERLPESSIPLAEAWAEIEALVRRRRADAELTKVVREARNRYNVRVHQRNLPFNYDGQYAGEPPSNESSEDASD